MHALLISQDSDETAIISLVLQRAGLTVIRSRDLDHGLQSFPEQPAELVVLVTGDGPPISVVSRLRAQTEVPFLVITNRLEEVVHAVLLDAGVDLVISRPFSARLLIAQVRSLLRRAAGLPVFTLPTLNVADLLLDPATRTFRVGTQNPKRLTQLEFRLLYTLMIHQGQVVPTEVLVEQVWGYTGEGERDMVRGLVRRLRSKVEPEPHRPRYIITVPGIGYTFDPRS